MKLSALLAILIGAACYAQSAPVPPIAPVLVLQGSDKAPLLSVWTKGGQRFDANGSLYAALLADPDVLVIEPARGVSDDMDKARRFGGAEWVGQLRPYTGAGVTGALTDGGILTSHIDFQKNPPIVRFGDDGTPYHGTSTYGIIFGDGTGDSRARGFIPDAQGVFTNYLLIYQERGDHTRALVEDYGCLFESNSWGHMQTVDYDTYSAEMDRVTFDNDILILNSQSNTGSRLSRPEAWAKNVLSVGGVAHEDTLTRADDHWSSASTGPASDGRQKPELAAFYDWVYTTSGYGLGEYTDSFGGTSAATPIVAGHAGIVEQMWTEGVFGPGKSVHPHAATVKALLIAGAVPWPLSQVPRAVQGWGSPSVKNLYRARASTTIVDDDIHLTDGQRDYRHVLVPPHAESLTVVLTWVDPPAVPYAARQQVNDLDLTVAGTDHIKYRGNWGMNENDYTPPWGGPDRVNTVEVVRIRNPIAGPYWAEVHAWTVAQDGDPATADSDVTFALAMVVVPCAADLTGDGKVTVDDALAFHAAYARGEWLADLNDDYRVTPEDFAAFMHAMDKCRLRRIK